MFDDATGAYVAVATVKASDPLIGWIAKARQLNYMIDRQNYQISLQGSASAAQEFAKLCSKDE